MTFDAYGAISCLNADSTLCGSDYVGKALETRRRQPTAPPSWRGSSATWRRAPRSAPSPSPTRLTRLRRITSATPSPHAQQLGRRALEPGGRSRPDRAAFTLPTLTSKSSTAPSACWLRTSWSPSRPGPRHPRRAKPITYTVTVTNTGTATAYDATLSDPFPPDSPPSAISGGAPSRPAQGGARHHQLDAAGDRPRRRQCAGVHLHDDPGVALHHHRRTLSNTATTSTYDALPGGHAATRRAIPLRAGQRLGLGHPIFPALATAKAASNGSATAQVNQPFAGPSPSPTPRRPGEQRVGDRRPPGRMEL